jgi:hypothetical protein
MNLIYGWYGFFVTMTPRLVFGIVIPLVAKAVIRHQEKASKTLPMEQAHV